MLLALYVIGVFALPIISLAAPTQYVPLVNIPGIENTGSGNLPLYLNRIYTLVIAIGALIAVVKIMMAGVKYSLSGIVTDKATAKSDIKGALLGLALLLVPYIVLTQINSDLVSMNILQNIDKVKVDLTTKGATPGNGAVTGQTPTNTGGATGSWGDNPSDPIDYETRTLTIPQSEFNTYSDNDIYSWYGRCGGEHKFSATRGSNDTVVLQCRE